MGTASDRDKRTELARKDDAAYRHSMVTARDIIYNRGYAVDCDAVNKLLGEESLVPTKVI